MARKSLLHNVQNGLEGLAGGNLHYAKAVLDRKYGAVSTQGLEEDGYITWDDAKKAFLPLHPKHVVTFHETTSPRTPRRKHKPFFENDLRTPPAKRRAEPTHAP